MADTHDVGERDVVVNSIGGDQATRNRRHRGCNIAVARHSKVYIERRQHTLVHLPANDPDQRAHRFKRGERRLAAVGRAVVDDEDFDLAGFTFQDARGRTRKKNLSG
jgi:hypothetical protein